MPGFGGCRVWEGKADLRSGSFWLWTLRWVMMKRPRRWVIDVKAVEKDQDVEGG